MEYLCTESFSDNQKLVIELRGQGKTYNQIIAHFKDEKNLNITHKKISKCLTRSSMGYFWEIKMQKGKKPYLCERDFNSLKQSVQEAASLNVAMDPIEVLDEASKLKGERLAYAISFLRIMKCNELLSNLIKKNKHGHLVDPGLTPY